MSSSGSDFMRIITFLIVTIVLIAILPVIANPHNIIANFTSTLINGSGSHSITGNIESVYSGNHVTIGYSWHNNHYTAQDTISGSAKSGDPICINVNSNGVYLNVAHLGAC